MKCPDDGTCHHDCRTRCFRVQTCVPLSASGWEDWPEEVFLAHGAVHTMFHGGPQEGLVDRRIEAPLEWVFAIKAEIVLRAFAEDPGHTPRWSAVYRLRGPVQHLVAHYDFVP